MKWFNNLKIRVKLILSFIAVAFFLVVVSFISIKSVSTINNKNEYTYENYVLATEYLQTVQKNLLLIRSNVFLAMYEGDSSKLQERISEINNWTAEDKKLTAKYNNTLHDDKAKELFDKFNTDIAKYRAIRTNMLNLIQNGKRLEATRSASKFNDAKDKVDLDVHQLISYNKSIIEKSNKGNNDYGNKLSIILTFISIIGTVLALLLGLVITRLISRPILKLVKVADKIAVGDFLVNLEVKTTDEIGELTHSFKNMMENIQNLINESKKLTVAAVDGNLDLRGDSNKFKGGYKDIIDGFNDTMDAVVEPIKECLDVLKELAKGNMKVKMQGNYKGSYLEIKQALNYTGNIIESYINELSDILKEISNGNLEVKISRNYIGDFTELKESINGILKSLNEVLGNINYTTEQVALGASQMSGSSLAISQGVVDQASSIEELTVAIKDIALQTNENAENAKKANAKANLAKGIAKCGDGKMQQMITAMDDISKASNNISKIIKVIDEIAFQTNILALNASVEAARAGQHGRGFAVVAEEVRKLAARCADAAKETSHLIENSIKMVEEGTEILGDTSSDLVNIVAGITDTATLVEKIAKASTTQASAISEINKGINKVSIVVQSNSTTAQENAATGEELSNQADNLKGLVNMFRLDDI